MSLLTTRQSELLAFIRDRVAATGSAPLIHEMMDAQDTRSISLIQRRLAALEARGLIERKPSLPRSVRLTEEGMKI